MGRWKSGWMSNQPVDKCLTDGQEGGWKGG